MNDKPIIKDDIVSDPKLPAKFAVTSLYFLEWLENTTKFRWESSRNKGKSYTCYKDSKGYWTAQKRVGGKLKAKRLGDSEQVAKLGTTIFWDTSDELTSGHQTKDDQIIELKEEIESLERKLYEELIERKILEQKIADLESQSNQSNNSLTNHKEVIAILEPALKFKANAGGRIKKAIKEALELIREK